jgi:hypothetical protein
MRYIERMSELKITLRGETADKLRKLVAEEHYDHPEDAVADALEALDASRDADLDAWLRDVIAARADAFADDPSRGLAPEEVLERLRRKP